jgi:membrane protease YdiL (CAAX protease family)
MCAFCEPRNMTDRDFDWRTFLAVVAAGLGGVAALVGVQAAAGAFEGIDPVLLWANALVVDGLLVGVAAAIGVGLGPAVGLAAFDRGIDAARRLALAVPLGLGAGALIVGLDVLVFVPLVQDAVVANPTVPVSPSLPAWQRAVAGLYGGVTEEILLRFGLLTLLLWAGWRLRGRRRQDWLAWTAIVVAAVLFGLGHLPATAAIFELTPAVIARAIVLNGIGGVVFGWLYWRHDLLAAMVAHYAADVVLLVVLPALS